MSLSTKGKKNAEALALLKGIGASASEAATAIQALDALASDPETPAAVKSQAVHFRDGLLYTSTPFATQKREEAMQAATLFAAANT